MIALSTVAPLRADDIYPHLTDIKSTMERGTVITVDAGVRTLAGVASSSDEYRGAVFPYLLSHLDACRPKDIPQHAEKVLIAVNGDNKRDFIGVLERRMPEMTSSQAARVRRVIRQADRC